MVKVLVVPMGRGPCSRGVSWTAACAALHGRENTQLRHFIERFMEWHRQCNLAASQAHAPRSVMIPTTASDEVSVGLVGAATWQDN